MARGLSLERVVLYFKQADLDVAEITLMHVSNIVGNRRTAAMGDAKSQGEAVRRTMKPRKRKNNSAEITTSSVTETLADA